MKVSLYFLLIISPWLWAETLVLSGPPAAVSYPLVHMAQSGELTDLADKVELKIWRTPDELRLMTLRGQADVLAMPTNVAANLYNKGQDVRLVNVSAWGILYLVSRRQTVNNLTELASEQVLMPFRGDMPDLLFRRLLVAEQVQEANIRYVTTPMDAISLLMARQADHALLAEPAVSMLLEKTNSLPVSLVAPDLFRAMSVQSLWSRHFNTQGRLPQAGIAITRASERSAQWIARIQQAYKDSLDWCQRHMDECADEVASHITQLNAEAVRLSFSYSKLDAVPVAEAMPALQAFFAELAVDQPAVIGGKQPDNGFYRWQE